MRSSELAALAGVTVRTLRHYHQIGVLPEPYRRSNGYRDYDAVDLVRLLRIKRLASLGVPLDDIGPMLTEGGSQASRDVLQQLDDELARRMEDLGRQRELLAQIRDSDAEADLPAVVGRYLVQLDRGDVPAPLRATERDHALLVHHLLGGDVADPLLARFAAALDDQAEVATRGLTGFAALTDDSSDDDVADVTEALAGLAAPIVADLPDEVPHSRHGSELITSLQESSLNRRQREVIRRVGERLTQPGPAGA
jgi:DNA-binding transcriptional MerR regulator